MGQDHIVCALLGAHAPHSGSLIVHEALAKGLPGALGTGWRVDDVRPGLGMIQRSSARLRTDAGVTLLTSTPMPIVRPPGVVIPVVYDLRWMWTRGAANRLYRRVDLHRTLRCAKVVLTISETVKNQILQFDRHRTPVKVISLGPGQVEGGPRGDLLDSKRILLIGSAPHKENERAAALLASSKLVRTEYEVVGISLSAAAQATLTDAIPSRRLSLRNRISREDLLAEYQGSSVYFTLGTSEGFGLAYVEAAYLGCDVIAPAVPVVKDALGAPWAEVSCDPDVREFEGALRAWSRERVDLLQSKARERSWDRCAAEAAEAIRATR